MEKNLEYYLTLPYTIELVKDQDEPDWFVRVKELPGCMSQGATPDEAILMIREAQELWLEGMLEAGLPIPEPAEPFPAYSGKFVVRVPQSLHRKLAEQAEQEGVSLNAFVTAALAEAVGYRAATTSGSTYALTIKAPEDQLVVAESGAAYTTEAAQGEATPEKRKSTKRTRANA